MPSPTTLLPHTRAEQPRSVVPVPQSAVVAAPGERPIGRYDYEDGSYIKIVIGGDVDTEAALEMVETLVALKRKELDRRKAREPSAAKDAAVRTADDEGFSLRHSSAQPALSDWETGGGNH